MVLCHALYSISRSKPVLIHSKCFKCTPSDISQRIMIAHVAIQVGRPPLYSWIPPEWADLISNSWQQEPRMRPTFVEILEILGDADTFECGLDDQFFETQSSFVRQVCSCRVSCCFSLNLVSQQSSASIAMESSD